MRGRSIGFLVLGGFLAAAALLSGCQTSTELVGSRGDAFSAAGGSGGGGGVGDITIPVWKPRPEDLVEVPKAAFAPVSEFFDGEGVFLGDQVTVDVSYDPFMAWFVCQTSATESGMNRYVIRDERDDEAAHVKEVRLMAAEGPGNLSLFLPRIAFARPRTNSEARPTTRPPFEFIGTEWVVVRFHLRPDPKCPVFLKARAQGTPSPQRPEAGPRECSYICVQSGRGKYEHRATVLDLAMEIRQGADGKWNTVIREPGSAAPAEGAPAVGPGR